MAQPLLELKNLAFSYGEKVLFKDLCLRLYPGERMGLMGPNGAGKTTLLRLIVGLLSPEAGQIIFEGKPCHTPKDFYYLRRRVGLVFQDPDDQLFCPTVAEDIAFGPLNLGVPREQIPGLVSHVLKMLGLEGFEERVTYRLSGGEKRLVALGTVLAMKPQVLLLDEPTGDLDPLNIEKLIDILKGLSAAQIIVSHDVEFLKEVTDTIYWLEKGVLSPYEKKTSISFYRAF